MPAAAVLNISTSLLASALSAATTVPSFGGAGPEAVGPPGVEMPPGALSMSQYLAVIVILSLLVLAAIVFTIFGLLLKTEAVNKSGPSSHHDSLLFADRHGTMNSVFTGMDQGFREEQPNVGW